MKHILGLILQGLFLLAVPVVLVTTSVRWAINDLRLYSYAFEKYQIAREPLLLGETGLAGTLPKEQLVQVAREFRSYFYSGEARLNVRVNIGGVEGPLFKEREIDHMVDVKGLVRRVYRTQEGSLAYVVLYVLAGLILWRKGFLTVLARGLLRGSLLTLAFLAVAGVTAVVAFPWAFYLFHLLGFRNEFWQLDPAVYNLTRIFPEGYFLDATMFIALASLVQALIVAVASWWYLRWRKKRDEQPGALGLRTKGPGLPSS
ncbi:MAG: DUF1461 domain-containing protein [Chloroflexi bacterium]|nr:DUF1461 domain-containing protein [Chloroflexota bacterium]